MLPRNHPDRIQIAFDDHRWLARPMLGCSFRTLAQHLGLRELVDHHLDLGGQDADAGRLRLGWRRLHRRRRCAAHRGDGQCSRLHGQGAIHPGHLPAQFSLGPRPSTGPGEPGVAGPGMGRWGRTRRLAPDHRPGLPSARPTDWPRRGHATTATPASGAITRCWPSPPAPARC